MSASQFKTWALLWLMLMPWLTGCGTLNAYRENRDPQPYEGSRADLDQIRDAANDPDSPRAYRAMAAAVLAVDTVVSVCGDTLMLPIVFASSRHDHAAANSTPPAP